MKTPWSLRDNPVSLTVMVIGVLAVVLTLGWLTVRLGSHWVRTYIKRQTRSCE